MRSLVGVKALYRPPRDPETDGGRPPGEEGGVWLRHDGPFAIMSPVLLLLLEGIVFCQVFDAVANGGGGWGK